jgi:hypothetical protein
MSYLRFNFFQEGFMIDQTTLNSLTEAQTVLLGNHSDSTNTSADTGRWEAVKQALLAHHHKPDLQAAHAVCASVAAHRLNGAPVWPMLVAPPGSMKTHLLGGFEGLPGVHFIDQITPKTFISGQLDEPGRPRKVPASLLHRIGAEGIIVYPDFSTVLAMKRDNKASILADMRRIYDGQLRKEFGTGEDNEPREWKGRITFVVAVTPAIDGYYSVFQTLGERFVMVRWPRAGGVEAAMAAMNQKTNNAREELKAAMHDLINHLPQVEPLLTDPLQQRIAALTEIAVRGRTHVPRSGYSKDIIYVPEAESATRLAQQLAQLAKGSALICGRQVVSEDDFDIVRRVAFDCLPPTRREIIECLMARRELKDLKTPESTLSYAVEDLRTQNLIEKRKLSSYAVQLLKQAALL